MKKTVLIILISIILTTVAILSILEIKAQRDQLRADEVEIINSKILNESRKLLVHLPKDYNVNTNKRYPVLYALDATSHDKVILNSTHVLSSAKLLPDLIIVGIVNTDRKKDLTPHYINQDDQDSELGKGNLFLNFLENEVIPMIDENYRTTEYKMISGNSRGGLFSFYAMIEKPNLFDAYFCYSPAFWRSENIIAKKFEESLIKKKLTNEFIYLSLGSLENEKMKKGFDEVIEILNKKDSIGFKAFYDFTENANHGTNAYYSIPNALKIWSEKHM